MLTRLALVSIVLTAHAQDDPKEFAPWTFSIRRSIQVGGYDCGDSKPRPVSQDFYLLCSGLLRDVSKLIHPEAGRDRLTAVVDGEFAPAKESSR